MFQFAQTAGTAGTAGADGKALTNKQGAKWSQTRFRII